MAWQKKLCGLAEAAQILGVSDTRVGQLAREDPEFFPPVYDTLACGRIWFHEDILGYAQRRELLLAARTAAREETDNGTQQLPRMVPVPEVVQGPPLEQP
jgi:hypothetical protein